MEEQNYEVEIKKSIFFANSSPEAIVHSVQKALFTYAVFRLERSTEVSELTYLSKYFAHVNAN